MKKINVLKIKKGNTVVFRNGGKSKVITDTEIALYVRDAFYLRFLPKWGMNVTKEGKLIAADGCITVKNCPFDVVKVITRK